MFKSAQDYYRSRERIERAAAVGATCAAARHAHEELERLYAERIRELEFFDQADKRRSGFSI